MARPLGRIGLSRRKARPRSAPAGGAPTGRGVAERVASERWARVEAGGGRRGAPERAGPALARGWNPDRPKGRTRCRRYERGTRPPGPAGKRFESLYLFATCRPGADEAFALALPEATAASMSVFLAAFAERLDPGTHAVLLLLDRAGWHGGKALRVPEGVWLYLRERFFLSHRALESYAAVLDAACRAWNALAAEPGRLASLTAYPYLLGSELP
jgi:hypothetical protein